MKNIDSIKARGQASIAKLIDLGKEQPEKVQTWAVVGGGALVGGVAMIAIAKGVLSVVGTLAFPPVSLLVGALGGGVAGWSYLQQQQGETSQTAPSATVNLSEPIAASQ